MVLSEGVDPSYAACKTTALPIGELSIMVDLNRFKPFLLECKSSVLSLTLKAHNMVLCPRLELGFLDYQSRVITFILTKLVHSERIELSSAVCKTAAFPLN